MFKPDSLVLFPQPSLGRVTFVRAIRAIFGPFAKNQTVKMVLRDVHNLLSPVMTNEYALILLKIRALACRLQTAGRMSCTLCVELILGFFVSEIFGHNWIQYSQYVSPPLDSIGSPSLLATGIFREGGSALQEYRLAISQALVSTITAAILGQSQIRTRRAGDEMSCVLEGTLPKEYLDGVPTVDLLCLLVRHASTLRRCQVDPAIGLGLFCIVLDGTLKLDVWVNAGTVGTITTAEFDQCLGAAIRAILALPRPGMITKEDSYYWGVEMPGWLVVKPRQRSWEGAWFF